MPQTDTPKTKKTKKVREISPFFGRPRDYFNAAVIIFLIGCIFGTYYEQLYMLITVYIHTGEIHHFARAGLIYGPFSPIYGTGGLIIYATICLWRNRRWYEYLIAGSLIGGALEYIMAAGQELFFGTRSWDYSDKPLNIGGRTTIPFMLVWGTLFVLFIYGVFPHIFRLYKKLPSKPADIAMLIIAILLFADASISSIATHRQNLRRHNVPPKNFIDNFCDEHYPDERLNKIYENAVPIERNDQ